MVSIVQWVKHLESKIESQKAYAEPFRKRCNNEYVLPFLAAEYRKVYGEEVNGLLVGASLQPPRSGVAGSVIDALADRMILRGWSVTSQAAQLSLDQVWRESLLDMTNREATAEALTAGRSFVSVYRAENDANRAVVGIDGAMDTAAHRRAGPPYETDAVLKVSRDEWTGSKQGLLRLPGRDIPLFELDSPRSDPEGSGLWSRWSWDPETVRYTGFDVVPTVEVAPLWKLLREPPSQIESIVHSVDILDLIEGLMVFAGHFGAVPIRWVTGLTVARTDGGKILRDTSGKPIGPAFNHRADGLWFDTNENAKFGQLTPAALDSFISWAEYAAGRIRAKTNLSSTYFSLDLKSHMSAELLKVDEAPLLRRVRNMAMDGPLNSDWRKVGKWVADIEIASPVNIAPEPLWADPETQMASQQVDMVVKLVTAGMGIEAVAAEVLDWPPEKIASAVAEGDARRRQDAEQGTDAAIAALLGAANGDVGATGA